MSANEPEDPAEKAGGLGEIVPEPLMPLWSRIERVQEFRDTHGNTYTTALEALTALALASGYLYWAFLFLTQ